MAGGSSKTSSTQKQETTQQEGTLFDSTQIAGNVGTLTQEFSPAVADAFSQLTEIVDSVVGGASRITSEALAASSDRSLAEASPSSSTIRELTPIIIIGGVILAVILLKGKA